ncbi:MAG TPA: aminotransferase class V-fold PLP-dependent enzyme [Anaerolineaceae bacterium]
MITYPIPMVPGPVSVPAEVLQAYLTDYGSADLEPEYLDLYREVEASLQPIFGTRNQIALMSGEGMLALWGALKSCITPGDRVLALATGVFGYGLGDMARSIGAEVRTLGFGYDETFSDWPAIEQAIIEFKPKMITAIHCETPSGTLNPIAALGQLKEKHHVPLLYVDAVASAGGSPVLADEWHVDLMLGGTQKVLSVPPSMSMVAVSPQAWEIIDRIDYAGYDALKPFQHAVESAYFPYTPYWQGLAALKIGARMLLDEGLERVFARHETVAASCRERITRIGLSLFPAPTAVPAPTVTAVRVPEAIPWPEFDRLLRERGLVTGGSYGPLADKVFRLGHMGSQATLALVTKALDVIESVCQDHLK